MAMHILVVNRFNVRVNCILPGFIQTPMTEVVPEKVTSMIVFITPLQRMGKPEGEGYDHLILFMSQSMSVENANAKSSAV